MLLAIALVVLGWLVWRTARQLEREARRVPAAPEWRVIDPMLAHSIDGCRIRVTTPAGPKVFTFPNPEESVRAMDLALTMFDVTQDKILKQGIAAVVKELVKGGVVQGSQN